MILFFVLWCFLWGVHGAVRRQLVDMTYTFDETTLGWPGGSMFEMKVVVNGTHDWLHDGFWLQMEEYSSGIHVGTHIDAPCHFALGKMCVDEIPLERLAAPAAVVDITEKANVNADAMVDIKDLKEWETISGRSLDGTIVVIRSGWGRRWKDRTAFVGTPDNDITKMHFPGMSPEGAQWLVDKRKIYGVMTESLSIDVGQSTEFMAHRILHGNNIYAVENVANVEEIPIVGAFIQVMPMKIGNAGGAPARIIAKFPKIVSKPKKAKCVTERRSKEIINKYSDTFNY